MVALIFLPLSFCQGAERSQKCRVSEPIVRNALQGAILERITGGLGGRGHRTYRMIMKWCLQFERAARVSL